MHISDMQENKDGPKPIISYFLAMCANQSVHKTKENEPNVIEDSQFSSYNKLQSKMPELSTIIEKDQSQSVLTFLP